jgi:hypothetical protein
VPFYNTVLAILIYTRPINIFDNKSLYNIYMYKTAFTLCTCILSIYIILCMMITIIAGSILYVEICYNVYTTIIHAV